MKVPFIKKFAEKQLNVLPPPTQEHREPTTVRSRTAFVNYISNNGKYRNLPPIKRMSDPERIEAMKRKMEEQRVSEDEERQ